MCYKKDQSLYLLKKDHFIFPKVMWCLEAVLIMEESQVFWRMESGSKFLASQFCDLGQTSNL